MSKKFLAGGALAAVLAVGTLINGAAIASADGDDITGGSVEAPQMEYENDAREDMELKQRAALTISDAAQAALASQPGEITSVEIEDEEGYVVYEVELISEDVVEHEMKVDAGNGDILASETEEDESDDDEERDDLDDDDDDEVEDDD